MAGVARNDDKIQAVTSLNHVTYRVWNSCKHKSCNDSGCWCVGGWDGSYYANATVNGKVSASRNVYVNGKSVVVQGDPSPQTATYSVSGKITSTKGTSGTGSVFSGNPKNVFISGVSVAVIGSNVQTFSGQTTKINSGSNNVFIGG